MQVTYKCTKCNNIFTLNLDKPHLQSKCKCGELAIKTFKNISMDLEDDTVTHAIEMMKYAKNPSGKEKTVI
jgi:predicted  nucleic acid-binding Zn-ribbon protein